MTLAVKWKPELSL